MFLLSI